MVRGLGETSNKNILDNIKEHNVFFEKGRVQFDTNLTDKVLQVEPYVNTVRGNIVNSNFPTLLKENVILTVGTGGRFSRLEDALNEAEKYTLNSRRFGVIIELTSNIDVNREIVFEGGNFSNVTIQSPSKNDLKEIRFLENQKCLFKVRNSILPKLRNFKSYGLGKNAPNNQTFIHCINTFFPKAFFYNNEAQEFVHVYNYNQALNCSNSIVAWTYNTIYDCNLAIASSQGSIITLGGGTIRNCALALRCQIGGIIHCSDLTLTANTSNSNIPFNVPQVAGTIWKP